MGTSKREHQSVTFGFLALKGDIHGRRCGLAQVKI